MLLNSFPSICAHSVSGGSPARQSYVVSIAAMSEESSEWASNSGSPTSGSSKKNTSSWVMGGIGCGMRTSSNLFGVISALHSSSTRNRLFPSKNADFHKFCTGCRQGAHRMHKVCTGFAEGVPQRLAALAKNAGS